VTILLQGLELRSGNGYYQCPDPYLKGLPESGSVIRKYGSGLGSGSTPFGKKISRKYQYDELIHPVTNTRVTAPNFVTLDTSEEGNFVTPQDVPEKQQTEFF
jgi:hypothetical protein